MMMLIALAAAAAQPSTHAGDAPNYSAAVLYGDLALAAPAGQRELDRRLRRAALSICEAGVPSGERILYDIDSCVAKILAESATDRRRAIAAARVETRTAARD
jgi:UrcA family protein